MQFQSQKWHRVAQVARPILARKDVLEVHRFEAIKADERVSMEMVVTRGPCEPLVKRKHFDAGFDATNQSVMDH
jgi:hypothetical protein